LAGQHFIGRREKHVSYKTAQTRRPINTKNKQCFWQGQTLLCGGAYFVSSSFDPAFGFLLFWPHTNYFADYKFIDFAAFACDIGVGDFNDFAGFNLVQAGIWHRHTFMADFKLYN